MPNMEAIFTTEGLHVTWEPEHPVGHSSIYICHKCGDEFARVTRFIGGKLQPYHAVTRLCRKSSCGPGGKYEVPGSITSFDFPRIGAPLEVVVYEFYCQLSFFDHKHPELGGMNDQYHTPTPSQEVGGRGVQSQVPSPAAADGSFR